MKEQRFFYTPEPLAGELPQEEAEHASRVLRLGQGDEIFLMDGRGCYYRAEITAADKRHCLYQILQTMPQERQWPARLHLAMAPTKNIDRVEWFAEKATEIGFDALTFLSCQNSERKVVKTERIERILVSAMKQSHKAWLPELSDMTPFDKFIDQFSTAEMQKFICHCHTDNLPLLREEIRTGQDCLVLIGPEGDFSPEEVRKAERAGFKSVSLGKSRLRTETAALVAVHTMQLFV